MARRVARLRCGGPARSGRDDVADERNEDGAAIISFRFEWVARGMGGRLFLVDGLFDLSYGPKDVVLLDGNLVHGVTGLRDLPGEGQASRRELERFSAILFSSFKRQGGMMAHGNCKGMWEESWRDAVLWK